ADVGADHPAVDVHVDLGAVGAAGIEPAGLDVQAPDGVLALGYVERRRGAVPGHPRGVGLEGGGGGPVAGRVTGQVPAGALAVEATTVVETAHRVGLVRLGVMGAVDLPGHR